MNGARRGRKAIGAVVSVGCLAAFACAPACIPESEPRHVILILLDAARPDRFSCYGYGRETTPEMDRLAARGLVFHHHYAQGTHTRASLPSLLYSRYFTLSLPPSSERVLFESPAELFRGPDDERIALPKPFEAAGFRTAAFSAHRWIGSGTRFANEFQEFKDLSADAPNGAAPPSAERVLEAVLPWIRTHHADDFFLYIHLMDTHFPHAFDTDAQGFFGQAAYEPVNVSRGGSIRDLGQPLDETDRRYLDALYDGSLRATDRQLGTLFDSLRDQGLLEKAIVAITSDHGENLLDGPGLFEKEGKSILTHGGPWFDPVARIPLILHHPAGVSPDVVRFPSEGVDVAPTLLRLAGVDQPPGKASDGRDLVAMVEGTAPPREQALTSDGIRTPGYKFLFEQAPALLLGEEPLPASRLQGRLFDLRSDPGETTDLSGARSEVVADLYGRYRELLLASYRRFDAARTSDQPESAFAIAAEHFIPKRELPEAARSTMWSGWRLIAPQTRLGARQTTDPLEISLALPNGRYRVSIKLEGRLGVETGGEHHAVSGGPEPVLLGEAQIDDETFRATLTPLSPRLAVVEYLGFAPFSDEGSVRPEDMGHLEGLRTLGYID